MAEVTDSETLEQRIKRLEDEKKNLEREKRGIVTDLQSEREKRHMLEARIGEIEQDLASPGNKGETADQKIEVFAKNPDEYIDSRVEARIRETEKRLLETQHQSNINEAYSWLAEQEGTSVAKLRGSEKDEEIGRIVKEYGLAEIDPRVGVKSAYKIFLQEQEEKKAREAKRSEAIEGNATETVRTVKPSGATKFTRSGIVAMIKDGTYEANREAILLAQRQGTIVDQ
jgi:hypothetical protein